MSKMPGLLRTLLTELDALEVRRDRHIKALEGRPFDVRAQQAAVAQLTVEIADYHRALQLNYCIDVTSEGALVEVTAEVEHGEHADLDAPTRVFRLPVELQVAIG